MADDVRERMVRSAIVLLARSGYQGTSFRDVIAHSRTPRGSIYHHFPNGKDELIAAAMATAGDGAIAMLDELDGRSAPEIVDAFLLAWRALLAHTDFALGCSVLGVTVTATSAELVADAGQVFSRWTQRLAELFVGAGLPAADAAALATLLIASGEGAVVLARAQSSFAPFDLVHEQMRAIAAAAVD